MCIKALRINTKNRISVSQHAFDFASGLREDGIYSMLDEFNERQPSDLILIDRVNISS